METRYDVWLHAFKSNSDEPAPAALHRVFGLSPEAARQILSSLPCVVRYQAPVLQAQRIMAALESIGGRSEMVSCAASSSPAPAHPDAGRATSSKETLMFVVPAASAKSSETLKLGTHELPALRPEPGIPTAPSPNATPPRYPFEPEPRAQAPAAPLRHPGAKLDALLAPSDSPFFVTRDVHEWMSSRSADAPQPIAIESAPPAAPLVLDLELAEAPKRRTTDLALPLHNPPSPRSLRAPNERASLPRRAPEKAPRRAPNGIPSARRAEAAQAPNPLELTLQIAKNARERSVHAALAGHPTAGFLLVLGSTTFAFWLTYVVVT